MTADYHRPHALLWSSAIASDTGPLRDVNEDACLDASEAGLWAVADGMGGHIGGQIASRTVIDAIDPDITHIPDRSSAAAFVSDVRARLELANTRLRHIARDSYGGRVIGSTVAVALAYGSQVYCLWAGDSRIYLLRGGRLRQLNHDHSAVAELVDRGLITVEQAKTHDQRNVITRAVGADDHLDLEGFEQEVLAGDLLLLCTDGLNKVIDDDELAEVLRTSDGVDVAQALVDLALQRRVPDNVTACVIQISDPPAVGADDEDVTIPSPPGVPGLRPEEAGRYLR